MALDDGPLMSEIKIQKKQTQTEITEKDEEHVEGNEFKEESENVVNTSPSKYDKT